MPATPAAPRRSWKRRLAALAVAMPLALLAGELAVRLRLGAPLPDRLPLMLRTASPTRGWQMVPGQDHYTYDAR